MVKAKWLSLERHVYNVHFGHGEPFPKCAYGELEFCSNKWFKRRKCFVIVMINILSHTHVIDHAKAYLYCLIQCAFITICLLPSMSTSLYFFQTPRLVRS